MRQHHLTLGVFCVSECVLLLSIVCVPTPTTGVPHNIFRDGYAASAQECRCGMSQYTA